MTLPTYATREQLMAASDYKSTSLKSGTIDRLLQAASRSIEGQLHRHFYPETDAKTFTPGGGTGFFLNKDLLSITSATEDGTTVSGTIEVWPEDPPHSWVGLSGDTVVITGVWGFSNDTSPAGTIAESPDSSQTTLDVSDSSLIGVGDMIIVDSERMVVTGRALLDTTANMTVTLSAQVSDNALTVSDGSLLNLFEIITIDAERMLVTSIAGNTVGVVRAYDGSTLAAHTATLDIYAPRTLTVERGATGTTAASHTSGASITRNLPPAMITALCIAEALVSLEQESSAYGRTVGSGDNERESAGRGLEAAQKMARRYKRYRYATV